MDSNDRDRLSEARKELDIMLKEDELKDAVLLIYANKQDLPNAVNVQEITEKVLAEHVNDQGRSWVVQVSICRGYCEAPRADFF